MVKTEIVQLTISIVIIAVLIASAATACNISASVSQSLIGTSLNPITFAETYIGNLSLNSGINLLSYLYTTAITYGIDARIVYVIGNSFTFFSGHFDLPMISPTYATDLTAIETGSMTVNAVYCINGSNMNWSRSMPITIMSKRENIVI